MRSLDLIDKCTQKADYASKFLEERNYESYQKHGQRISAHRTMRTDENDDGVKEVFIGKIPRDLFEDELLPKLEKAGRVRKMRLMMDFSGTNRGYAYAEFVTSAEARQAVKILSGTQIRSDELHPIAVLPSFDNKKLYLGNLPVKTNKHELRQELDKLVDGIDYVDLVDCAHGASSRLALVTFESHDAATGARRILCPGTVSICDRKVTVEWAKPQKPYDTSPQKSSSTTSSSSSSSRSSFECVKSSSYKGAKSSSSFEGAKPSSRPSPSPHLNPELMKLIQSIGDMVIGSSDKGSRNSGVTNPSWAHQQQQHDQQQKRQQQQHQFKRQLFHQLHHQSHQQAQPQHHLQRRRYQHQQPNQKVYLQRQQNFNQYHRQLKLDQIQHNLTTHLHQQHQLQLQTHQQQPLLQQQQQLHQQLHPLIPSIPDQLDDLDLLNNAIKIFQTGGIEEL